LTPGAQVEAAVGLLAQIEQGGAPADDIVANYFRRHRFAGVRDRGAISKHIYAVLRERASLDWWIANAGDGLATDARTRMLAALVLVDEWSERDFARAFDGDRFRPAKLTAAEHRLIGALGGRKLHDQAMPPEVRGNYPAWLAPHLEAALGRDVAREMAALNGEAALDLRINLIKAKDREQVRAALMREGVEAARTPLSPLGLRVFERVPLATLPAVRDGMIEVQDEGSQLAALLVDARPGMRVVDFCAGAGGKTLALAAAMRDSASACGVAPPAGAGAPGFLAAGGAVGPSASSPWRGATAPVATAAAAASSRMGVAAPARSVASGSISAASAP